MPSKRIILMYISEVSGHHSATIAIEKAVKTLEPGSEILNINAFNYTNPITEKIVNKLYMGIIKRTPKIWDYLYDNPAVVKNVEKMKETIHKFNSPKLKNLFDSFKPDAVLCTQAFPCGMCADYKKTYGSSMPLIAVLTDYIPHSYWLYDMVDQYITPSEEVSVRLMNKGVPIAKIKALGIPFDPSFSKPVDPAKIYEKLGLDALAPTLLIMGGGQGLGPIKTIVASLEKAKSEFQEIVVTGTNKRLFGSLKRKLKKFKKKIVLFGYTQNINELMAVANIIITKPGGVTVAEVLSKGIPMIIVKPIPGQEANNTEFLTGAGAAIKLDEPELMNEVIDELFEHPHKLDALSFAASRIGKPNASVDIAKLLLSL
jgi:processive 1,2-diacylglycerol beta-glucosyltransferase